MITQNKAAGVSLTTQRTPSNRHLWRFTNRKLNNQMKDIGCEIIKIKNRPRILFFLPTSAVVFSLYFGGVK